MSGQEWRRIIILVDMNAFFASIEQLDYPQLRQRPIGVTNGEQGTCIITSSYEARALGVKTGMRLKQARQLCPQLIQRPARPQRYAQVSRAIMQALHTITPDMEIFSVDEAFLDMSACRRLRGDPQTMGHHVKRVVYEAAGLPCSIGISGDKTTAKFAAKLKKPDGFTIIPPWEAKARLSTAHVTELCGIAGGIASFLAQYGVHYCGDVEKIPISVLAKRFGNIGRRIWYMCQGADPEPLHYTMAAPKSMGHGKVMPPKTRDRRIILTYLLHMSEKLGSRLRRHDLEAQLFFVGLRSHDYGWIGDKARLVCPTNDGQLIYRLARDVINSYWCGEGVGQVQVTALDPKPLALQLDFFMENNERREQLNKAVDEVNQRFGEFKLSPARLLGRSSMPNVIAPAWQPDGVRQTV